MPPRRAFRPADLSTLEDRLAPSSLAPAHVLDLTAERASSTVHGTYATTSHFGVDTISSVASLKGTGTFLKLGAVDLSGSLSNTFVVPFYKGPTSGTIVLNSARGIGALTVLVTGHNADLAPTQSSSFSLTFTVVKATGQWTADLGAHGSIAVTFQETIPATGGLGTQTSTTGGNVSLAFSGLGRR
jgi:hypothetical protein